MKLWTVTMVNLCDSDVEPCTSVFSSESLAESFAERMRYLLAEHNYWQVIIDSQNLDGEEYYDWFLEEGRL